MCTDLPSWLYTLAGFLDVDYGCKSVSGATILPSTIYILQLSKSLLLWETTATKIATYMLKKASCPNLNLVANSMNQNKLEAVLVLCRGI